VELRFPRDYHGDPEAGLLAMIQSHLDADAALDMFDRLWDTWGVTHLVAASRGPSTSGSSIPGSRDGELQVSLTYTKTYG
jgi:hypothetical protein